MHVHHMVSGKASGICMFGCIDLKAKNNGKITVCGRSRMVTAFHRLAVWPHMRVSDDNAGHEEPLIAALYNNTFHVVRSPACLYKSAHMCFLYLQDVQTPSVWI